MAPQWQFGNFRRLNIAITPDQYPVLHIQDFSAHLAGATIFSKVDLVRGYHQVPVHPQNVPKTAVITPFGLFEILRMSFGLKGVVQTFQCCVTCLLRQHSHGSATMRGNTAPTTESSWDFSSPPDIAGFCWANGSQPSLTTNCWHSPWPRPRSHGSVDSSVSTLPSLSTPLTFSMWPARTTASPRQSLGLSTWALTMQLWRLTRPQTPMFNTTRWPPLHCGWETWCLTLPTPHYSGMSPPSNHAPWCLLVGGAMFST